MRASLPLIATILLPGILSVLSGCGLKGELYLPDEPPPAQISEVEPTQEEDDNED